MPRDSANHGDGQCNANRRRRKVVVRQPGHLREIAHRCFRRVGLPIRVGGEGYGRVPGKIRRHVGKLLGIPRHPQLQSLEQIEQNQRNGAENQHGRAVLLPAHFLVFVHSTKAIDEALHRTQNEI